MGRCVGADRGDVFWDSDTTGRKSDDGVDGQYDGVWRGKSKAEAEEGGFAAAASGEARLMSVLI